MRLNLIFGFFSCLLLSSCDLARFDRPPQPGVSQIPQEFHGNFYYTETDSKEREKGQTDTIFYHITAAGWEDTVTSRGTGKEDFKGGRRKDFGDSLSIFPYGDHYVLGIKNKDRGWSLFLVKKISHDIAICPILEQPVEGKDKIEKYFAHHKEYLLENNRSITICTMNEEKLKIYLDKNSKDFPWYIMKQYNP